MWTSITSSHSGRPISWHSASRFSNGKRTPESAPSVVASIRLTSRPCLRKASMAFILMMAILVARAA
nr:hypothetical protein [uncultured Rhodococcus sp.]